jgi:undecaprenyl-diphosphatase
MPRCEMVRVSSEDATATSVTRVILYPMSELSFVSSAQSLILDSPLAIAGAVFAARWLMLGFLPLVVFCFVRGGASRHAVSEAVWALVLALLCTTLLSRLIDRPRPFEAPMDPNVPMMRLIPPPYNASFPSGHTAASVAMAAAFVYVNRRIGFIAVLCAASIAFGRLFVGVHYPTDLLGGLMVGLAAFFTVRLFHQRLRRRDVNRSVKRHSSSS